MASTVTASMNLRAIALMPSMVHSSRSRPTESSATVAVTGLPSAQLAATAVKAAFCKRSWNVRVTKRHERTATEPQEEAGGDRGASGGTADGDARRSAAGSGRRVPYRVGDVDMVDRTPSRGVSSSRGVVAGTMQPALAALASTRHSRRQTRSHRAW